MGPIVAVFGLLLIVVAVLYLRQKRSQQKLILAKASVVASNAQAPVVLLQKSEPAAFKQQVEEEPEPEPEQPKVLLAKSHIDKYTSIHIFSAPRFRCIF